jgi:hypothetical protein
MQLIADRFAVLDEKRTIDLATGRRVDLTMASAGGESEQTAWALRCGERQRFDHPAIAPLVDYGTIGESRRFEALDPAPRTAATDAPALTMIDRPEVRSLGELFESVD